MANEGMRENWTLGAAGWIENERVFDRLYAPVTDAIVAAAALGPGRRVLDVGCGTGSLLAAAAASGASTLVGIDIAPTMAEAARNRVPAAEVVADDAQTADLSALPGAPFDRVVSRFGLMFFADPAAAFANLRAATGPGAELVAGCWRALGENPMFSFGAELMERLDPRPEIPPPGAPGPMAFADGDRLAALLTSAGWAGVSVEPLDFVCDFGFDGSDGVDVRMAAFLATSAGRLARRQLEPALGAAGWAAVLEELRAGLRRQAAEQGTVRAPAATWIARARNP